MNTFSKTDLEKNRKYLELLSNKFPNITTAVGEVVNLRAILNLPKSTEHFLTDIHGEHEAFNHVMQKASGAIRRKVMVELGSTVALEDLEDLTTLIYYPEEKLELVKKDKQGKYLDNWYELTIYRLVKVCRAAASKYTRSKVRKALPKDFAYIMEELFQEDEHRFNKKEYYNQIIHSLVDYGRADHFIIELSGVIKRFTTDHLHIIGDIFDRGPGPEVVMETLMKHHSLDMQWGNHDILWMGAAAGNPASIANVVRIALRYANIKAISIIQFKMEDALIARHPEYNMKSRQLLRHLDLTAGTVEVDGVTYPLNDTLFPTIDPDNPTALTEDEQLVIDRLVHTFCHSEKLQRHIRFMYAKGSMYLVYNSNLLFHA